MHHGQLQFLPEVVDTVEFSSLFLVHLRLEDMDHQTSNNNNKDHQDMVVNNKDRRLHPIMVVPRQPLVLPAVDTDRLNNNNLVHQLLPALEDTADQLANKDRHQDMVNRNRVNHL
jgi:hypothetical protein